MVFRGRERNRKLVASRLRSFLSALGKLGTVGLILIAFAFGLALTVYISLRSPEVRVPDVSGKSYAEGESALEAAGLDLRERARRYKSGTDPGIILDQSPRGGEVVKKGQTVAVIVSRAPREGESVASAEVDEEKPEGTKPSDKGESDSQANENQNRPRNRNTNKNKNANNANNSNSGNQNSSANTNRNSNANTNRGNANNRNSNANRNRNANNRNTNTTGGRNANQPRANTNRRPPER